FEMLPVTIQGHRDISIVCQTTLHVFEKLEPDAAMLRPIAPISTDARTGTLPFAHQKEAATFASTAFVGRMIKSEISFVSVDVSSQTVPAALVWSAAIARLPVALNSLNSFGRVSITRAPDAGHAPVLGQEQCFHFRKQIKFQRLELRSLKLLNSQHCGDVL